MRPDEVPPDVAEVIQCADDLWASSVAKFKRLADLADTDDHRVRGAFVFAGGSATGRFASYGAQIHNLTRKTAKDPAAVRQAMVRGHKIVPAFGPRVTDVLKGMLRPALIPAPGNVFVVADWAAIEGRVNPWLSNCPAGEVKLDVFRSGLDPYKVNAMATFSVAYDAVTGEQRQVGKVQELALGFLGGEGSFHTFGKVYGVQVDNIPRAIRLWRTTNPWAMQHGQDLESAYTRAMRNKGREFPAGRVVYMYDGQHLWYALPSGRVLCYPFAKLEAEGVSYLKAAWKPAADATEWPRAACGAVWRSRTLPKQQRTICCASHCAASPTWCCTVHDEVVVECPEADGERVAAEVERVMCEPPEWAVGLPLGAEVKIMARYGK
jgi:DNA polymerase bacteriophage-type